MTVSTGLLGAKGFWWWCSIGLLLVITGKEGHGDCRGRHWGSLMAAGHMISSWGHWPRTGRLYSLVIFVSNRGFKTNSMAMYV